MQVDGLLASVGVPRSGARRSRSHIEQACEGSPFVLGFGVLWALHVRRRVENARYIISCFGGSRDGER